MSEPQWRRADSTRPTVVPGARYGWWTARGYDTDGNFHVKTRRTLKEAHDTATDWATNGYPEPTE